MLNITNCSASSLTRISRPPIINSRSLLVIIAVVLCLVAAMTLFLNAVVIIAVCKSSSRHDRRPSLGRGAGSNTRVLRLLMASMAVADAVVAVVIMPVRITEMVHNGEWIFPMFMCKIRTLTGIYLCTVSIYHVMGMAIDRYMAICRPMSYRLLTVRTACVMAGLFWTIPVFLYILPVVGKWIFLLRADHDCEPRRLGHCKTGMHEVFSVVGAIFSFYIPFLVIFVLYSKVLLEVRNFHKGNHRALSQNVFTKTFTRTSKRSDATHDKLNHVEGHIESHRKCFLPKLKNSFSFTFGKASDSSETVDAKGNATLATQMRKSGKKRNSTKALLSIGLIVITFTVTWLPFSVFKVIFGMRSDVVLPSWAYNVTIWMGYFNSTLNPLLFCLHKGLRTSVKNLLFPKIDR